MSYRGHAAKPTAALWLLVAAADLGLVLASVGIVVLIALASVVAITAAAFGTWRYLRRGAPAALAARVPHRRH
ncbi:MAG TPA: hypothetical protein VFR67_10015 [Pilimelia sp.]|nr:hypothetical protein [Pilimelia sp.]